VNISNKKISRRPRFARSTTAPVSPAYVDTILHNLLISMIISDNPADFAGSNRHLPSQGIHQGSRELAPPDLAGGRGEVSFYPPSRKSLISMIISDYSGLFFSLPQQSRSIDQPPRTATRWRSPPESGPGQWSMRGPRPSCIKSEMDQSVCHLNFVHDLF
jgi:hypothetical protein